MVFAYAPLARDDSMAGSRSLLGMARSPVSSHSLGKNVHALETRKCML
jgi:hypothetical protein